MCRINFKFFKFGIFFLVNLGLKILSRRKWKFSTKLNYAKLLEEIE
jgi:hypothetical protein